MDRTGSDDDLKTIDPQESVVDFSAEKKPADTAVDLNLETSSRQSSVVTARGTADGLVIRLDGRVECDSLRGAINDFLSDRKSFVNGQTVSLEWIGAAPEETTLNLVTEDLRVNYAIKVRSSEVRMVAVGKPAGTKRSVTPDHKDATSSEKHQKLGLFGGIAGFDIEAGETGRLPSGSIQSGSTVRNRALAAESGDELRAHSAHAAVQTRSYDPTLWDDADTRLVCRTLRSGQKIETEHSLLVIGDINSGAELVAGGDIIVMGALRGVAHAGAFDETGGGRFIFALDLDPTQLRIGAIISRGSQNDNVARGAESSGPELARVDGNIIVVEPYSARAATVLRR